MEAKREEEQEVSPAACSLLRWSFCCLRVEAKEGMDLCFLYFEWAFFLAAFL